MEEFEFAPWSKISGARCRWTWSRLSFVRTALLAEVARAFFSIGSASCSLLSNSNSESAQGDIQFQLLSLASKLAPELRSEPTGGFIQCLKVCLCEPCVLASSGPLESRLGWIQLKLPTGHGDADSPTGGHFQLTAASAQCQSHT